MATAYAALVSLTHIIEQIQVHRPRRPIFFKKQLTQIQSLYEKVCFFQNFLESNYSSVEEAQNMANRIADVAHAAEDIIESYVVDNIVPGAPPSKNKKNEKKRSKNHSSTNQFSQVLMQKVIQDMELLKKEMMEINEYDQQVHDPTNVHSTRNENDDTMVGFDDHLNQIMDRLTRRQYNLQIIPITGMGGIGKTTLAHNVYYNPLIMQHFDIRAWVTVSQVYSIQEMLLGLIRKIGVPVGQIEQDNYNEDHHLGKIIYQYLSGRMYLIVLDDLWKTEAWDKLKLFFPDDNNGSRIMVTTRLLNVAKYFGSCDIYKMDLLDENKSWDLLRKMVFIQEDCPFELEELGKKIAKNCQGLPLSIVVIGGLLVKSKITREFWEYVAKHINKIVNSEDSGCMEILSLSYRHLPIYLQPCFLQMGVFPEDHSVRVSKLIKLWVVEGFLKPNKLKTLEDVAKDYLKDLTERHLIMIDEWGSTGTMKTCRIHDLLRDLCLREAEKDNFLFVTKLNGLEDSSQSISGQRRIVIQQDPSHSRYEHCGHLLPHAVQSAPLVRSLTFNYKWNLSKPHNLKLLRLFHVLDESPQELDINLVNLRYMHLLHKSNSIFFTSSHRLWNLQILVIKGSRSIGETIASLKLWEMPHLRHLIADEILLSDPPSCGQVDGRDNIVLKNLQTLKTIVNFKCSEEVLTRIPNIKKLGIKYECFWKKMGSHYCLNNLGRLHKLESLICRFPAFSSPHISSDFIQNIMFPQSLKKLTLNGYNKHHLGDTTTMIGSLPRLEKLKLIKFCTGEEWNLVEVQFIRLKFLLISNFNELEYWMADNTNFPVLERLHLSLMRELKEIPSGFGEIETLESIRLHKCRDSVVASAKKIMDVQKTYGNEGLRLSVIGPHGIKVYDINENSD